MVEFVPFLFPLLGAFQLLLCQLFLQRGDVPGTLYPPNPQLVFRQPKTREKKRQARFLKITFAILVMFFSDLFSSEHLVWSRALCGRLSTPIIGAAEPISPGATPPIRTSEPAFIARIFFGHLHELGLLRLKRAVGSSGSTHEVRAAVPGASTDRATASRTPSLLRSAATRHAATRTGVLVRSTLPALLANLDQIGLLALYLETGSHCYYGKELYNDSHLLSMCDVFLGLGLYQCCGSIRAKATEITQSNLEICLEPMKKHNDV